MKITMLAVAASLTLGALQISAARRDAPQGSGASQGGSDNAPAKQDSQGVGTDAKDAGKSTGAAAKDTGKIVATDTKKGVHKAANGLGKVADKFKHKDSSKADSTTQSTGQTTGHATGNGGAGTASNANGGSTADGNTTK